MADTQFGYNASFACRLCGLICIILIVAAVIFGGQSPAAAQMRPEPPGLRPDDVSRHAQSLPPPRQTSPGYDPVYDAAGQSNDAPGDDRETMVVDVRIAGNKSVPLDKILPHIRTRAGRPFDLELINEDVRRLDRTRMFVNVETFWSEAPGGRIVIFDVLERPLLQEVKYVGCREIGKKTLQKETNLKAGDSHDPFAVEEARRKIEELYHTRGFAGAKVTILEGDKPDDRRAVFYINEGTKQQIRWISFVGNRIVDDARLKKTVIKSKTPFLYLFNGELDHKQLDDDVDRLVAYYRGLGFFKARIGRELSYSKSKKWVSVKFIIDEGPRFKIRNVSVIGNKQYSSEELLANLNLNGGEFFNQSEMTADIGKIQDKYGGVGYVFADVKADPRFLEEPGQLDLVYNVTEGDRYRVGKINVRIKGEYPHTQLTTILNRLSLKPGDIIDIREIRASERRIKACGLFESNPASGQAPKIVFHPPGQEGELEDDREERIASRPGGRSRNGGGIGNGQRGGPPPSEQDSDPVPQGRILDITLNCGRLRPDAAADEPLRQADNSLWQAADELTNALAQRNRQRLPHDRLMLTQYSPNAGQVNPASQSESDYATTRRQKMAVASSDATSSNADNSSTQATTVQPTPAYGSQMWPRSGPPRLADSPEGPYAPGPIFDPNSPFYGGPPDETEPLRTLDFDVLAHEAMTGRMMFGVGINSDAGLVGQILIDEQNFDWTRFPRGWEDIRNATAWRGAGQRMRIEAVPGTELQRYMVTFQEPYLLNTAINLGLSGYYYNRSYTEWYEQRIGGRVALGYQFAPDLSGSVAYRGAKINITDVIDPTMPVFADVLGRDLALHGFQLALTRDKRDSAFMATEGHLLEMSVEQVVGSFCYPRAEIDFRKYFKLRERPDGSGRHVLSMCSRVGYTGDNTPVYEHFYAGGFSSLRGFEFRGASPHVYSSYAGTDVFVGGQFMLLASLEYMFPITADDMIHGVVFCDSGTVEPSINDWNNRYRVAPGFGLRISVPAMGPAPIALDFAAPISWDPGDQFECFSFFVGFGR